MADENASPTGSQPTQKEAFFFLNVISCMKNKPDVDWAKVAELSNYSNANCAKTRFGQVKKRLGYTEGGFTGTSSSSTPRAKKDKATGNDTNLHASKVTKTPTKRGPKKVKPEEEEFEASVKKEPEHEVEDSKQAEMTTDYEENENNYYDFEEGITYLDSAEDFEG